MVFRIQGLCGLFSACLGFLLVLCLNGPAQGDWNQNWENTVAAAEKEGQVTLYGPRGTHFKDAFEPFRGKYPKIKLIHVTGSGSQNSQRLFAERRAGKYLADVFISGAGTAFVLFKGNVLDPLPPNLLLPETKDPSLWFSKKHLYADPKNQYVFIIHGNVDSGIGAYNTKLIDPKEIKSFWDLLKPKWKGRMVAFDPTSRGQLANWKAQYYHPRLGPEFVRRLFSEMDVTIGTDERLMLDWVAKGRFSIYLAASFRDTKTAKKQGLPIDLLEAAPSEGYLGSGNGHLSSVNKPPHPNAAKVFINWLLSKEGQVQYQRGTGNNSLRMDIPKDMVANPRSVPKPGVEYLIASLAKYRDITPIKKIVQQALRKRTQK